jgi:hypothetical protein
VLYFELDRPLNLPWASRCLGPASPESLREQGRTRPKSSRYVGVKRTNTGWHAYLKVDGKEVSLGGWADEKRAAVARDRAVLYFGLEASLNLPRTSRPLGAASTGQLRREAKHLSRRGKCASSYIGIIAGPNGRWRAKIWLGHHRGDTSTHIATFDCEEHAAIAYDRVACRMRPDAVLNFPERRYRAASIDQMRAWAQSVNQPRRGGAGKQSRFYGITQRGGCWLALVQFTVGDVKQSLYLGTWPSERAAALARDRAVLYYGCARARINFPAKVDELVPTDARSLVAEATRARRRSSK